MSSAGKKFSKFLIGVGLALSSMADAYAKGDPDAGAFSGIFALNGNDAPSFWGKPISTVYFDETGLHSSVLENAVAFAQLYAEVSRTQIAYHGRPLKPTIGLVISDNRFDTDTQGPNLALNPALIDELLEIWGGTPLEPAFLSTEARSAFAGIQDGNDCSLFVDSIQVNGDASYFVYKSVVIVANSNMTPGEISLCFHNKIALSFGMATNNFDAEKEIHLRSSSTNIDWLQTSYFGFFPGALQAAGFCWRFSATPSLECIQDIFWSATEIMNEIAKGSEGRLETLLTKSLEDAPLAWESRVSVRFHHVEDWQVSALQAGESLVHLYSSALGIVDPFDPTPVTRDEQYLVLAVQKYEIFDNEVFFENPAAIQSELTNRLVSASGGLELDDRDFQSENCLLIMNTSEEGSHDISTSIIVANSSLSRDELELCFRNRISAYFGLYGGEPERDFELLGSIVNSVNFYFNPLLLQGIASCRDEGEISTKCVGENIQSSLSLLL